MSNETKNDTASKSDKGPLAVGLFFLIAILILWAITIYQDSSYSNAMKPISKALEAGNYDFAISQLESIETTHPGAALMNKKRFDLALSEARNLKVIAEEERIRGKETAALVDVIKSSSGENRQMMLKKLLELDPDTKEFPEEMIAVRRLKREEEARAAIEEKERKIREVKMKISSHFASDGSHIELTQVIKDSMRKPSTYHHIKTTIEIQPGNSTLVKTTFSGQNNVYTTVENTAEATLYYDGDIKSCSIRGGAVMGGYRDVE